MKLFRMEVKVWATAYVHAETPDEAWEKAQDLRDTDAASWVSDTQFNAPDMPELSLSPAMTIGDIYNHTIEEVDTND